MEQINIIRDYNDRRKREYITTFEDLSTELIYEIFEYLPYHQVVPAFHDLNQRFKNLFNYSNFPIKIKISSISKSEFQHYLEHIITPYAGQIKSLWLSNPFAADMSLLLFPIIANLIRLEALILNNIEFKYIEQIVNHLSLLPALSSLTITSTTSIFNRNNIYYKIFHLCALKYCQLSLETSGLGEPLSVATNEFSSIEQLVINNQVWMNQIHGLLSYVPQLRRLSIEYLNGYRNRRPQRGSMILNLLTNLTLKVNCVSFNDFELLVADYFRQVQVLRVVVHTDHVSGDNTYIDTHRWQQLISTYTPNLCSFECEHQRSILHYNSQCIAYGDVISKYNSSFRMEHKRFSDHPHDSWSNIAGMYSRNPNRKRDYILDEKAVENMGLIDYNINKDLAHRVYIHNTDVIKQFIGYFPNATELTINGSFDIRHDSIITSLNHILPLKQLTKLSLSRDFHFKQFIELLQFTENLHTVKLGSILHCGTRAVPIQQDEMFQIASKTNIVANVTIDEEITLSDIQVLIDLFPRMQYLAMILMRDSLKSVVRFLLSKSNDNACYLSSLCVSRQSMDGMKELKILIESEKLLHDYILKLVDEKLYLWW